MKSIFYEVLKNIDILEEGDLLFADYVDELEDGAILWNGKNLLTIRLEPGEFEKLEYEQD